MILREQIHEWLESIGTHPEEVQSEEAEWVLKGEHREIPFLVISLMGGNRLVLRRQFKMMEPNVAMQRELSPDLKAAFLYDLKRDLLLSHTRFDMDFADEEATILKSLVLENYVYVDGLNQEIFFTKLYNMIDASVLFIILVKKYGLVEE